VICASSVLLVASNVTRTNSPFEWPGFVGAGHLLQRMSEDIDLRIVGREKPPRSALKRLRHKVTERLEAAGFTVEGHITVKQSDRYVRYDLPYEPIAEGNGVLRPEIKIEIAAFPICTVPERRPVSSFVAEARRTDAEASEVPCVRLVETAADKFVGLGRRGGFALSGLGALDPTLVRHVYDLSRMDGHYDAEEAVAITIQTMKAEAESRADDYPAYRADPRAETLRAFELMCKDEKFADDYAKLLDEMVYGEKPEFTSAFEKVRKFAELVRKA